MKRWQPAVLGAVLVGLLMIFADWRVFAGQAPGNSDSPFLRTHWTTENGLPQNSVTAIAQTPDGYLWLATFGGLVRFDGVKFTIFNTANTPAMENNRITALYVTRDGALWIGGENSEVLRYAQGEFVYHALAPASVQIIVRAFYEDRAGDLWIGADRTALFRLKMGDPAKVEKFTTQHGLPTSDVFSFCEDKAGNLWIGTVKGLARFRDGMFTVSQAQNVEWKSPTITRLHPHPKGGLWVATSTGFGHFFNDRYTAYLDFPKDYTFSFGLVEHKVGDIWFSFRPDQIQRIKDGVITTIKLQGVPQYVMRVLFEDREGNLWMGTNGAGLIRLRKRRVRMFGEAEQFPVTAGPGAVVQDNRGDIWLGTNIGLYRVSENGLTTFLSDKENIGTGRWGGFNIGALYPDKSGSVWIGKTKSLIRYKDKNFTHYPLDQPSFISAITEDRQGRMWLGTVQGLVGFRPGEIVRYRQTGGLVHDDIKFLMEDRAGALWIGTVGGLSRFKDGAFTNYTTRQGLSNNYVRDIYEDRQGVLWIATYGGGLNRLQDGRITQITARQGLFDDFISRILVDEHDRFWMLGNRGVFRVSRQELNECAAGRNQKIFCVVYDAADGMTPSEGNGGRQSAGWRMRDGRMWFPTVGGMAIVDPHETNPFPPPVLIEQALFNGQPLEIRQPLKIPPNQESLEIHYTGLSFGKPELLRFSYRMAGLDKEWTDSATRRIAFYPHLPPGDYTFHVKAISPDGVRSVGEASLAITVLPPFWRQPWFLTLAALGVTGLVWFSFRQRVAYFRRRNAQQEAFARQLIDSQERQRQRIAAELHDGLSQSLVIIHRRVQICLDALDDPERAREQLQEIAEASIYAINEVKEVVFDLRPQQLDRLGLTGAVSDLLDRVAGAHGWRLTRQLDELDGLFSKEAENSVYRIVQESINNISKHAEATTVTVNISRKKDQVELTIADNGLGFVVEIGSVPETGSGLQGITERARLLGGQAFIESSPGKGTDIRLRLPLKDANHES